MVIIYNINIFPENMNNRIYVLTSKLLYYKLKYITIEYFQIVIKYKVINDKYDKRY